MAAEPAGDAGSGFTLIEVLIVLGIIAVLAGIVLPVVARARSTGYEATCTSNLRQIGLAFRMYHDDYSWRPRWMHALVDNGYIRDTRILHCRKDPTGNYGGEHYHMAREWRSDLPDETITYSYMTYWQTCDAIWKWIEAAPGSSGPVACQMHGQRRPEEALVFTEGLVLRLTLEGSVVRRINMWERGPFHVQAEPWRLFSDGAEPPPLCDGSRSPIARRSHPLADLTGERCLA